MSSTVFFLVRQPPSRWLSPWINTWGRDRQTQSIPWNIGSKGRGEKGYQPSPLIRGGHVHHVCSIVIVDTQEDLWSTPNKMYPPAVSSRLVVLIVFVVFGWMAEVSRASEILERGLRLKTGKFGRRMLKIAGALRMALKRKKRDGRLHYSLPSIGLFFKSFSLGFICNPSISNLTKTVTA